MKKFFIPPLGYEFTLAKDWTFTIINDHRNESLITWMNVPEFPVKGAYRPLGGSYRDGEDITLECTLPKGTVLKIDRIYIRRGLSGYDSVTFFMPKQKVTYAPTERTARQVNGDGTFKDFKYITKRPSQRVRFFAKLDEVNTMVVK